jgi:hypothetical protein
MSTMTAAGKILGTPAKTATMELTEFEWKIIGMALSEAQTMPNASKQLAEEIAELIAVQLN